MKSYLVRSVELPRRLFVAQMLSAKPGPTRANVLIRASSVHRAKLTLLSSSLYSCCRERSIAGAGAGALLSCADDGTCELVSLAKSFNAGVYVAATWKPQQILVLDPGPTAFLTADVSGRWIQAGDPPRVRRTGRV